MKKNLLFILLVFPLFTYAQLEIEWTNLFHNKLYTIGGSKIKLDSEENVIVVGGNSIIKYDRFGNELWNEKIQEEASYQIPEQVNDFVAIDQFDNIYVLFNSSNDRNISGFPNASVFSSKYSPEGIKIWTNEFRPNNGLRYDNGKAIKYKDNKIYITGSVDTLTSSDVFLVCYNAFSGEENWRLVNNDQDYDTDSGRRIILDDNGFIYVGGISTSKPNNEYYLLKYDSLGNLIWKNKYKHLNQNLNNILTDMTITTDNKIIMSGLFYITSSFNDLGELIWSTTPASALRSNKTSDSVTEILAVDDGSVILTGHHTEYDRGGRDFDSDLYTLKMDKNGNILWHSRYKLNDTELQHGSTIGQDLDNNILIGGGEIKEGISSFLINKYDNLNGDLLWNYLDTEFENYNSRITSLQVSAEGKIYVTGIIRIDNEEYFLTKKYREIPVSIKIQNNNSREIIISPNPTIERKFKIFLPDKSSINCQIQIFNSVGKKVFNDSSYKFETEINLLDNPQGIYFIRIKLKEQSIIKKLCLTK